MASVILYCKLPDCGVGYASVGDLPVTCPSCGRETKWSTSPRVTDGVSILLWSQSDRRFLRSIRIDPE